MDPNVTLRQIDASLRGELPVDGKRDEVDEGCDDLRSWIRRGGCEPNWSAYPLATAYYQTRAAQVKRDTEQTIANLNLGPLFEVAVHPTSGSREPYTRSGNLAWLTGFVASVLECDPGAKITINP